MSEIKTRRISELAEGTTLTGFYTIGVKMVSGAWNTIKVNLGFVQAAADSATAGATAANAAATKANAVVSSVQALENSVKQAETKRVEAETARVDAETKRVDAETKRVEAETARVDAETARVDAETKRVDAETARQTASAAAVQNAEKAAERVNNLADHRDEVRDGYWWRWNEATGNWENTGELAKGGVMYATFEVDEATSTLSMYTDAEYTGATIALDEETGILTLTL